jgi:hypothetical protein
MTSKESNSRFDRAITMLQSDFKLLPVGISDSGGWRYAFIYDLVHHHYPDLPISARNINENIVRDTLVMIYFKSIGAATLGEVIKFFQWGKLISEQCLDRLVAVKEIIQCEEHPQLPGKWFAIPDIMDD